jgi:hypothetical protein
MRMFYKISLPRKPKKGKENQKLSIKMTKKMIRKIEFE